MRHEHRITCIAEQLEQQRVRFARARRQRDSIRGNDDAATAEVSGNCRSRRPHPERLWIVFKSARIRERLQKFFWVIEAGTGWIRLRQVDDRRAAATPGLERARNGVRVEIL